MEKPRLWNFNYIYLLCLSALTATAFQMVTPFLPGFAVRLGASLTVAGIIAGLFSITALVARPFSGFIADRLNKKWLMVAGTAVIALAVLGYSFADSIAALFAIRIVHGIAFAVSGTTNIAFASSFIPDKRMGEGISYLGMGHILAMAVGPNIGVWVVDALGLNWVFIFSFMLAALSAFLMLFIKYSPPKNEKAGQTAFKFSDLISMKIIPFALFGGLFSLLNGLSTSFMVLLGDNRGIANVGLFFTFNAVVLLLVRPFGGKLIDKKGLAFVLIPSYIFGAAAMAVLAGAGAAWMLAVAGALKAAGQGMGQPGIQAECIRLLPEKRGVATGTYFIGADIGQGLGPIIGGAVSAGFGYGVMFSGAGALMIVGLISFCVYKKYINSGGTTCCEKQQ